MVEAIVSGGGIRPLEPLPPDWREGQRLRVERADDAETSPADVDRDFAELARLCEALDPAYDATLQQALDEARRQAKEKVRRQMGLP